MKRNQRIFIAVSAILLLYTIYLIRKPYARNLRNFSMTKQTYKYYERSKSHVDLKYHDLLQKAEESKTELYNRVGTVVLVMAYYRSGSSFFGQLFNQNPEAFYLFEPLLPFTPKCDRLYDERLELLTNISKCDFRGAPRAYNQAHSITGYKDQNIGCLSSNVCFHKQLSFVERYRELCVLLNQYSNGTATGGQLLKTANIAKTNSQAARFSLQNIPSSCKAPFNISLESAICQTSKIVAYKILRVCDFARLEEVYKKLVEQGTDVYVIHLVRDPRAMIYSGLQLEIKKSVLNNHTIKLCRHLRRNLQYLKESKIENGMVSKGKVLQVRYEDLASDTVNTVQKVYNFIGHEFNDQVRHWLRESAVRPGVTLAKYRRQMANPNLDQQERVKILDRIMTLKNEILDPYGTARNPNYILMKWQRKMLFETTKVIQTECKDVMSMLEYKSFETAQEQNDLSHKTW